MNCTNCGAQNPDHARFCNQCGKVMRTQQTPSFEGGGRAKRQRMILLLSILVALVGAAMAFYFSLSSQRDAGSGTSPGAKSQDKGLLQSE
ncbi:MAG: zinc-ribbon domain-containing protein [Spirochaetes bacterium]|nr:zinc-ribbon domain-containing protein [Spirochaetota bacterium]